MRVLLHRNCFHLSLPIWQCQDFYFGILTQWLVKFSSLFYPLNPGSYKEAAKHFEEYHRLSQSNKEEWFTANGTSFYTDACIRLNNIYTIIGTELGRTGEEEDDEASLEILTQALEMAKCSELFFFFNDYILFNLAYTISKKERKNELTKSIY